MHANKFGVSQARGIKFDEFQRLIVPKSVEQPCKTVMCVDVTKKKFLGVHLIRVPQVKNHDRRRGKDILV